MSKIGGIELVAGANDGVKVTNYNAMVSAYGDGFGNKIAVTWSDGKQAAFPLVRPNDVAVITSVTATTEGIPYPAASENIFTTDNKLKADYIDIISGGKLKDTYLPNNIGGLLDANGKVKASYLPSYVDDVIECVAFSAFTNNVPVPATSDCTSSKIVFFSSGTVAGPYLATAGTGGAANSYVKLTDTNDALKGKIFILPDLRVASNSGTPQAYRWTGSGLFAIANADIQSADTNTGTKTFIHNSGTASQSNEVVTGPFYTTTEQYNNNGYVPTVAATSKFVAREVDILTSTFNDVVAGNAGVQLLYATHGVGANGSKGTVTISGTNAQIGEAGVVELATPKDMFDPATTGSPLARALYASNVQKYTAIVNITSVYATLASASTALGSHGINDGDIVGIVTSQVDTASAYGMYLASSIVQQGQNTQYVLIKIDKPLGVTYDGKLYGFTNNTGNTTVKPYCMLTGHGSGSLTHALAVSSLDGNDSRALAINITEGGVLTYKLAIDSSATAGVKLGINANGVYATAETASTGRNGTVNTVASVTSLAAVDPDCVPTVQAVYDYVSSYVPTGIVSSVKASNGLYMSGNSSTGNVVVMGSNATEAGKGVVTLATLSQILGRTGDANVVRAQDAQVYANVLEYGGTYETVTSMVNAAATISKNKAYYAKTGSNGTMSAGLYVPYTSGTGVVWARVSGTKLLLSGNDVYNWNGTSTTFIPMACVTSVVACSTGESWQGGNTAKVMDIEVASTGDGNAKRIDYKFKYTTSKFNDAGVGLGVDDTYGLYASATKAGQNTYGTVKTVSEVTATAGSDIVPTTSAVYTALSTKLGYIILS